MIIREALKGDANCIAETQIQAWRTAYKGIMPDEYLNSLSVESRTKQWQEALSSNGPGINLIIEHQNIVSGFCVYGPARDDDLANLNAGEIVALNIVPGKWRLGLGTELIKNVIASAHNRNWTSLYLWVVKENHQARNFYESNKFNSEGREKIDFELTGCELHELRYVKIFHESV